MIAQNNTSSHSGIYITFSGNCKTALTFYQACIGGRLHYEIFEHDLPGYAEKPVVSGLLISERIIIHGSDLVPDEGRIPGNNMSVFLHCNDTFERKALIMKLAGKKNGLVTNDDNQNLVEVTDAFDVRWILAL